MISPETVTFQDHDKLDLRQPSMTVLAIFSNLSQLLSIKLLVINRHGVYGAVLQTAS